MDSAPEPMTQCRWAKPVSDVPPHAHAIALFEEEDDLLPQLRRFLDDGIGSRQLIAFVHGFPAPEEAWAFLARAHPFVRRLEGQVVLVSAYRDAFEGRTRRIDHDHVAKVVDGLVQRAKELDLTGVRIFVDASRRYFADARDDEWFAFEAWLGRRLHASIGLVCAYHAKDIAKPDIFERALHTHAYRFGV